MRPFTRVAWTALKGFVDHDGPVLAAAIAYHVLLSVFPLLLGAVATAAFLVEESQVRTLLADTLTLYLPPQAAEVIFRNVEEATRARGSVGAAAIGTFLWSASAAAGVARHALNRVWEVKHPRAYWQRKLLEIGATLLLGTILGASLVWSVALGLAERFAPEESVRWARGILGGWGLRVFLPFILAFLAFLTAYWLLPNRRIFWQALWPGTLTAAILFELARQGMLWGVSRLVQYQLVYGSLAGVVVFLIWGYVVAAIFLLGAEVSRSAHHLQAPVRVPDHDEIP
ncbi:MAG: YihY/virulence factor BrkB family protein [Armatimonadota bacterium]|nr:YihY/virulence factor BrkB family protein [Armatimonadota bacterium]MDR7444345.1 YihY/virulence factor BrkB family protein [Armatimonadota bacterium]MDR7569664.1 YihY/virulence factor BrkB family protein [Armatimonadota bacterium]MDR7614832.1 YihY/virulence factor BrkB family protein [Armatimonadota bacterium]